MIVRNPCKENACACSLITFLMIKGYLNVSVYWKHNCCLLKRDQNVFHFKVAPISCLCELVLVSDRAIKHLLPFLMTYNCEFGFSILVEIRSKKRNLLVVEPQLQLKISIIKPDTDILVPFFKRYHHWPWYEMFIIIRLKSVILHYVICSS